MNGLVNAGAKSARARQTLNEERSLYSLRGHTLNLAARTRQTLNEERSLYSLCRHTLNLAAYDIVKQ